MIDAVFLKKVAKIGLNLVYWIMARLGRVLGLIDFPVPAYSSMRKTSSRTITHYRLSGIRTYLPIATEAERLGLNLRGSELTVLDFGCGVARQLAHFTKCYPNPTYYACDIDDTSIAFVAKNYPQVRTYVNSFSPPLAYPDSHFDLVYSVSIFSHLNMEDQRIWLRELARVTKSGGYLFLTTEGITALRSLAATFALDLSNACDLLEQRGYLYKEYEGWEKAVGGQTTLRIASNLVGVERSYGNTVLSPAYIRKNWCDFGLKVVEVIEGIIDHRQDLVVLQRTDDLVN